MPPIILLLFITLLLACGSRGPAAESPADAEMSTDSADVSDARTYADPAETPSGDSLFSVYNESDAVAYLNQRGDTIVPFGRYLHGFADTITTYGVVMNAAAGPRLLAIDPQGRELYEVYWFDNGPDYAAEGLFRILRNGQIGYADTTGRIVIPPQFACASSFEEGRARVSFDCQTVKDHPDDEHERVESDSWFFIDKNGRRS